MRRSSQACMLKKCRLSGTHILRVADSFEARFQGSVRSSKFVANMCRNLRLLVLPSRRSANESRICEPLVWMATCFMQPLCQPGSFVRILCNRLLQRSLSRNELGFCQRLYSLPTLKCRRDIDRVTISRLVKHSHLRCRLESLADSGHPNRVKVPAKVRACTVLEGLPRLREDLPLRSNDGEEFNGHGRHVARL